MHHCAYLYEYGATRVGNIAHLMMLDFSDMRLLKIDEELSCLTFISYENKSKYRLLYSDRGSVVVAL